MDIRQKLKKFEYLIGLLQGATAIAPPLTPDILTQANIYIDPQNSSGTASDRNDGLDPATPLLTNAEWKRRLVAASLTTKSIYMGDSGQTIHLMSDGNPNDPIDRSGIVCRSNTLMRHVGGFTATRSSTFATMTPRARATNTYWTMTAASAFTSADVGSAIHDTARNTVAWIDKVTGATARTTTPYLSFSSMAAFGIPTMTSMVNGDAFEVGSMRIAYLGREDIGGVDGGPDVTSYANFIFERFDIRTADTYVGAPVRNDLVSVTTFVECAINTFLNGSTGWMSFINCMFGVTSAIESGGVVNATVYIVGGGAMAYAYIDLCGCQELVNAFLLGSLIDGDFQISDHASIVVRGTVIIAALAMAENTVISVGVGGTSMVFLSDFNYGVQAIWGVCASAYFMTIGAGAGVYYGGSGLAGITVGAGAPGSGAFTMDGLTSANPWDTALNKFLAPITCTMVHMLASVGAGGFGGYATEPRSGTVFADS